VNVDGVCRLLEQRQYIEEKGRAGDRANPSSMARPNSSSTGWSGRTRRPATDRRVHAPIETANRLVEEMGFDVDESSEVS